MQVIITHDSDTGFRKEYYFSADRLKGKKSIHFYWKEGKILWKNGDSITGKPDVMDITQQQLFFLAAGVDILFM